MLGTATWTSVSSNCSRSPGCTRYSVPPSLVGICTPGRGGAGLRDSHLQWQRRGGVEVQAGGPVQSGISVRCRATELHIKT